MRIARVLTFLLAVALSQATSAEPLRVSGAFIAVIVQDVDASVSWYQEKLGLRLVKKTKSPRGNAGNVVLAGEGFFVELIYFVNPQAQRPVPAPDGSYPPGLTKGGAVLTREEFATLFARLQKQDAKFLGSVFEDREMEMRSFIVEDNEQNLIQFFAPL
jgi:catechol 2,3-dioxygenase-like lactoylglutathione lyase family enzyme